MEEFTRGLTWTLFILNTSKSIEHYKFRYREWISPATVTYIINEFIENWEDQPDYVKYFDWYFLPVQNPDGYEYSHTVDRLWRKNLRRDNVTQCKGIDLNRNYGYEWGGRGTSNKPCSIIYRGLKPFSEPETRAVQKFFEGKNGYFNAFVSFHSYGQYIIYPWSYDNIVPEDNDDLLRVGKLAAEVSIIEIFLRRSNVFKNST